MKKRINLIFILVLSLVLLMAMVACNQNIPGADKLPDKIGDDPISDVDTTNLKISLRFTMPRGGSSFLNAVSVADFVLSDYVKYEIVYTDSDGKVVKSLPLASVTSQMIHADDVQYLTTPGHHNIRVTYKIDEDKSVSGSFALHLTDPSGAITPVTFKFNLNDTNGGGQAYPYFATSIDSQHGIATKTMQAGVTINSWDEFLSMFAMGLEGKALESASAQDVELSATTGFPFTIETDTEFSLAWTDDIIHVKYDLNVPDDAQRDTSLSSTDPLDLFKDGGDYANLTAQASVGRVIKPDDAKINVYYGYFFAGWFNKADDRLWRFSNTVGKEDIELYARWISADYSFTIYTMGGQFANNLHDSVHVDPVTEQRTVITASNAERLGYTVINSESRFTLSGGLLNRISFSGFHYGVSYDKYVAEVAVSSDSSERVMLKFSEFYRPAESEQNILIKGDGDYLVLDDLYSNYECTTKLDRSNPNVNAAQPITYVKWLFNKPDANSDPKNELFLSRISKYYTELIFKDGYSILADGSVRLDQIADWNVNELIIPESLTVNGQTRPLTEIGDRALSNAKALTSVDMSRASSLTTIGIEAFAYDDALKTVQMPTFNAIANIGDNAFKGTNFETKYAENNKGAEFIVIGNMIYKYVGKDTDAVDLSNPSSYYTPSNSPNMFNNDRAAFNAQLAGVTSIEDGAFANCPSLTKLSLSSTVTTIRNNALSGLESFDTLIIPASGSRLSDIGETAFNNTPFLSTAGNLYDEDLKAIIIGEVYYRYLDTSATDVTIPAKVTRIAPRAFANCTSLAEVNFEKQDNIVSVGREAFLDTRYVRTATQGDAFTVVNKILVNYYGPTQDANAANLIVPSRVNTIGAYAFGKQASYFRTVQINDNVTNIENNAFVGAISLASIIFPDVKVNGNMLTNIPTIGEYAFAGSNGELLDGTVLYFSEDVITFLQKLSDGKVTTKDPVTLAWLNFYMLNSQHFMVEDISTVVINPNVISKNLMRTRKTQYSAFTDKYGTDPVEGALIITSNTGVAREDSLSWSGNSMQFIEVTETGTYAKLWEKGVNKFVVKYNYNGKDKGCPIDVDDPNLFVVTINNAINGIPAFYSSSNYDENPERIDANELSKDGNFWFEGLESTITDGNIPTYFTSHPGFDLKFVYKDIDNVKHELIPTYTDLRTNAVSDRTYATLRVNFYGLGTYVFDFAYAVKVSRYTKIEQTGAITIPVNANAFDYLRQYSLNFIGEDGNKVPTPITANTFNVIKVDGVNTRTVNTTDLGMHTMTVEYTQALALRRLEFEVRYTVVLKVDETLFDYETFNDSYMTARIIRCNAPLNATTIVLPSRCEIDGQIYNISQIGFLQGNANGVFENYKNLTSVYLPETIQNIGVNTFRGCSALENIYTAMQAASTVVNIPTTNTYFEEIGNSFKEFDADMVEWTIQPVKLLSLANLNTRVVNEIIVGNEYVVEGKENVKYRIVAVENNLRLSAKRDAIDIYLPDTIYTAVNIVDSDGNPVTPIFYASGSNFIIKTVNNAPEELEYIGTGAFSNCTNLKNIDLTKSDKLQLIGVRAFAGSGLKSIDLSKNTLLVDINNQAFENCRVLDKVVLNESIEHICINAFSGCVALTEIGCFNESGENIGLKGVTSIDETAFNQCRSLTGIEIYGHIARIGANAFSACNALTIYVHLPKTNFGNNWNGTGCPVVWEYDGSHTQKADDGYVYVVIDSIRYALDADKKEAIVAGQMYVLSGDIVIGRSISYDLGGGEQTFTIKTIGKSAFENNLNITSVTASSALEKIEPNAFAGCTNLLTFTFTGGNGLKEVASTAFEGCVNLVQRPQVENSIRNDA